MTTFRTTPTIQFDTLFNGTLAHFQVQEVVTKETTPAHRCLRRGDEVVWVDRHDDGSVGDLTVRGYACPTWIFAAISRTVDVKFLTEGAPQFYGYASEEESDAAEDVLRAEREAREQTRIRLYAAHLSIDLSEGPVGLRKIELAQRLVALNPALIRIANTARLLQAVSIVYGSEQAGEDMLTPTATKATLSGVKSASPYLC